MNTHGAISHALKCSMAELEEEEEGETPGICHETDTSSSLQRNDIPSVVQLTPTTGLQQFLLTCSGHHQETVMHNPPGKYSISASKSALLRH